MAIPRISLAEAITELGGESTLPAETAEPLARWRDAQRRLDDLVAAGVRSGPEYEYRLAMIRSYRSLVGCLVEGERGVRGLLFAEIEDERGVRIDDLMANVPTAEEIDVLRAAYQQTLPRWRRFLAR